MGAPAGGAPAAEKPPLDYSIEGDNLQILRVRLKAGQEIFAEAGRMVFKNPAVIWETRATGESLGAKIWGMVKRKLSGESLFFTYFRTTTAGEVGFAGSYPGRIEGVPVSGGASFLVQRDAFLAAEDSVDFSVAFVKKLGAGFFGGEGFILEKFTGPGTVFIHGGGDFVKFQLQPGEVLQVDPGCIVGFDEGVDYDIQFVGSIKTAIFGGEGLFLATLKGPGRCIVQTMTLSRLRRELGGGRTGGEQKGPLGALGGLTDVFSSED